VSEASGALELTDGMQARIRELQALSKRAEGGDKAARRELRRAVRESAPGVVARCSDFAGSYRRVLAKTASGSDPLLQEALEARARLMEAEVAGPRPSPLESLLAERVVSGWLLVELMEALVAGQLGRDTAHRVPASYLLQMVKLQESANRRYLSAIKTLAQVRKLQVGTPAVLLTQINVG
jgi:hypothetical protein